MENKAGKLLIKVFAVGMVIAILSYLFHPEVGQFSLMLNGSPVAEPLVRFAAIPSFLVIMLVTGVLMVLLFMGVGLFIFLIAIFMALLGIGFLVPFSGLSY